MLLNQLRFLFGYLAFFMRQRINLFFRYVILSTFPVLLSKTFHGIWYSYRYITLLALLFGFKIFRLFSVDLEPLTDKESLCKRSLQ